MENEIKLLKNNDDRTDSDLEWIQEFYEFLQGNVPKKMSLGGGQKLILSQKKAFCIIWYLQEHFSIFPDTIERCDNCGGLYDSACEGRHWETKGKFYCGGCDHLVPANADRGRK